MGLPVTAARAMKTGVPWCSISQVSEVDIENEPQFDLVRIILVSCRHERSVLITVRVPFHMLLGRLVFNHSVMTSPDQFRFAR